MRDLGITHMLSMGVWPDEIDTKIKWMRIVIEDYETVPILPILD